MTDKWIEVQIKTEPELEEIVTSILYDLGVGGLAIEDPNDVDFKMQNLDDWDYIEPEELKKNYDSKIVIKGYFPENDELPFILEEIRKKVEILPSYKLGYSYGSVSLSEVYEKDWANSWKKYYHTTKIGENIVIKPSWEKYEAKIGENIIELDPGMAFGTGTHETTILCVKELEKYVNKDTIVLDVGCGSGILSIVSAKLGAKEVFGIDIDSVAVNSSERNVKNNNVEDVVDIKEGNLINVVNKKYDVVVANILAEVILILNKDINKVMKEKGVFIASGIIKDKEKDVVKSLRENNLEIIEINHMEDWVSIVSKIGEKNA